MHAPETATFRTDDPELAHAVIVDQYSSGRGARLSGSVEKFALEHSRQDFGELRLDAFHSTFDSEYDMDPLGCVAVLRVIDGTLTVDSGRSELRLQRGDVFIPAHADSGYVTRQYGPRMQVAGIDLSLIDQVTDGGVTGVVDRLGSGVLSGPAARAWRQSLDYFTTTVAGDPQLASSPLVLGQAGRLLAATMITVFGAAQDTERSADRTDATPAVIRRATTYMQAHPDLDLSVADVARASFVSIRTLQMAFRRHLATTPMAYLRRVRLDHAHRELLTADPDRTTVTAIAVRWGFAPSRFAVLYRNAYGEPPSHSLRRNE